jgi:DNA modification methylase
MPKAAATRPKIRVSTASPPALAKPTTIELAAEWVRPDTLKPWAKNPRKNDGEPVNKVAESIRRFGFAAPIVARKATREIIAGHTRWKAAAKLGLDKVPVRFIDISEREAHLLALADNRLGELADWDDAQLHEILASYDLSDINMAGWDDKALRELERAIRGEDDITEDDVPEPPKNPITKLGDLIVLGKHRLVCGDSRDPKVVSLARAKLLPFIMVSDPPYGVNYDPEWRKKAGINNSERMGKVENDHQTSWIEAYKHFTGDVSYLWCGSLQSPEVAVELDAVSFERRSLIIWNKPSLVISRGHYHWKHETLWYAVREGKSARWCGDRTSSTVWEIARKDGSEETIHSTQKPVECMARPIRNHGVAGDVVYDPFCGSGTTLIAAEQLQRICVAIELSPAYCDVIVERWQKLTGGKARRNPVSDPEESSWAANDQAARRATTRKSTPKSSNI